MAWVRHAHSESVMTDRLDSQDPAPDLTAFADGELDSLRRAKVLEHLALHPKTAAALGREVRFREAIRRSLVATAPPPASALRERIMALQVERTPSKKPSSLRTFTLRSVGFPVMAAAMLFLALGLCWVTGCHGLLLCLRVHCLLPLSRR